MYILLKFFFYIFNIPVGFLQKCNKKKNIILLSIHFYTFLLLYTRVFNFKHIFNYKATNSTNIQINNRRNRNIYVKLGVWYGFCNFAKCQINKLNF